MRDLYLWTTINLKISCLSLTASSAMLMQSVSVRDTIRGVRHAHKPASVISLHPVNSSSKRT